MFPISAFIYIYGDQVEDAVCLENVTRQVLEEVMDAKYLGGNSQ